MKKLFYVFITAFSMLLFGTTVYAQGPTVTDDAQLFTPEQIQQLNEKAAQLNEKIVGEVFIVTTTANTEDPEAFADNFLANAVGNNQNGSVLLLDMGQRKIQVSTSGNMIDYITDSRLEKMLDNIYDQMSAGNYYQAAEVYLQDAQQFVEDGVPSGQYRIDRDTGKITYYKSLTPVEAAISLGLAAIISLVFFFRIKSSYQLKSGGYKYAYQQKASVTLTQKEDRLVNSFVTTRRIPRPPKNNGGGFGGGGSTTHSRGGGSFGGGGRSF